MRSFVVIIFSLFAFLSSLSSEAIAQDEETEPPASFNYWNVQFFLRPSYSTTDRHIEMFLPTSDDRQDILNQRIYAPEYEYRQSLQYPNIKGVWSSKPNRNKPNWIIYSLTAHTQISVRPEQIVPSHKAPSDYQPGEELDAGTRKLLVEKMKQLDVMDKPLNEKIRVIFDYVSNSIAYNADKKESDIKTILEERVSSISGKVKLFIAFMREMNLPARRVAGLLLEDRSVKKGVYFWAQVHLNDQWVNFDVHKGHFGSLPENYLAMFYGNEKLFKISEGIDYDYQFVISKTSEEAALDTGDLVIPQDNLFDTEYFKKNPTEKESYVKKAFGRIVVITDRIIDEAITEKISQQAAQNEVKISFYSAPYESQFFRGNYIAKIVSQKLDILKKADAIFILSEDDAGLYALFQIAQNKKNFKNASIFLSGNFTNPVAQILGHALYRLVKPREFFIASEKISVERAWDIVKDNILDGLPIQVVSKRWSVPFHDLSLQNQDRLSRWRKFVIETLILASKSEVNLQSIYLVLVLPFIALIIVICRNIIGIETFGTFTPVIVAVAFLTTGAIWGSLLFAIIIAVGVFFRYLFSKIHLHIVARMAMLIGVVCITMLAIMILGVYIGWGALINISILPMVIMAGIVENFTQTQMEVGSREAFRLTLYTLLISVVSYAIIDSVGLHTLILIYPEWILLAILAEILIGLWSGMRLMEYFRFYKIIGPQPQKVVVKDTLREPQV